MSATVPAELTGAQKAAVFIMQMDRERAAKVLRAMRETEVAEITAEIARLREVSTGDADAVLAEFVTMAEVRGHAALGGLEAARALLEDALGVEKAAHIIERLAATISEAPFQFLRNADPRQVLSFIQDEHPQTISLVLAYMPSDTAAMVLSGLPEDLQRTVAHRVARMDRTSPETIDQVEEVLQRRFSAVLQPMETMVAGGVQSLVDILNRSDRATERLILEGLERDDVELADEVRQKMFVFEDIVTLDDKAVQLVLRQVDGKALAVALKGVRDDVRQKILRNMSDRAATTLVEEIEMLGAVRLKHVEEAQGGVVRVIRTLEESGQIVLSRSADEFVE